MREQNQNILIIGAGFFSQRAHIPIVKKFFSKKNIFLFDERIKLASLVAKKFNINQLSSINNKYLIENKIQTALICYKRERSFYYSKKLLNKNINLLCEKPVVFNYNNLKYLINLSKKKKIIFKICYQKNFFNSVIFLKENMSKFIKKYGKINHINFELFNGNMRCGKKSFCRTKESIQDKKKDEKCLKPITKKRIINYKIFLNRYIHSINLFHSLFNFSSKIKKKNFKIITKFNYYLSFIFSNANVSFFFGDYNFNTWHDKIVIIFEKAKINLDMIAPLDFKNKTNIKLYDGIKKKKFLINFKKNNVFEDQFISFLNEIENKKEKQNYLKTYLNDYYLLKNIWKIK